ncbi:immediate early response gene 2 protein [Echeneis naucrates]|uniref:Immediate early response gene 2 protein-like n=1 Tax=Echeneis naucrates TaxID=173247 RepID=A0A665UPA9_ECHNA|nr:immediate early response gene 2 protein-like [Echeneis naucrates]
MEVSAEAKRIMVVALGKLYSSRSQRGGLRLQRSLLLTLVMKSARDIYHAAQAAALVPTEPRTAPGEGEEVGGSRSEHTVAENTENKENRCPAGPVQQSRKRRGKAAAEPDFLPCKRARLEQSGPQQLFVSSVFMDYVKCSSDLGAPPAPLPVHRAIAAC